MFTYNGAAQMTCRPHLQSFASRQDLDTSAPIRRMSLSYDFYDWTWTVNE